MLHSMTMYGIWIAMLILQAQSNNQNGKSIIQKIVQIEAKVHAAACSPTGGSVVP